MTTSDGVRVAASAAVRRWLSLQPHAGDALGPARARPLDRERALRGDGAAEREVRAGACVGDAVGDDEHPHRRRLRRERQHEGGLEAEPLEPAPHGRRGLLHGQGLGLPTVHRTSEDRRLPERDGVAEPPGLGALEHAAQVFVLPQPDRPVDAAEELDGPGEGVPRDGAEVGVGRELGDHAGEQVGAGLGPHGPGGLEGDPERALHAPLGVEDGVERDREVPAVPPGADRQIHVPELHPLPLEQPGELALVPRGPPARDLPDGHAHRVRARAEGTGGCVGVLHDERGPTQIDHRHRGMLVQQAGRAGRGEGSGPGGSIGSGHRPRVYIPSRSRKLQRPGAPSGQRP
ncbi:MAG: hypothetical protein QM704_12290 [Anaeromyxobacteraceae bacterium]